MSPATPVKVRITEMLHENHLTNNTDCFKYYIFHYVECYVFDSPHHTTVLLQLAKYNDICLVSTTMTLLNDMH